MLDRRLVAALLGLALLVVACSPGPGAGGRLEGTDWVLRSLAVDGQLTIAEEGQYADAEFDARRISGWSGCNTYDARYRAGGRTLFVSPAAVTLMACDEATMGFEQTFLANLAASRFYTASRTVLNVYGADGATLLVFDAAPRNPLLGPWIVDSFAPTPNSLAAPLEGTQLDVTFGLFDVSGSAGCNRFDGTYNTNGNAVRIGRLATTRMACDPAILDQEQAFLDALQGVAFLDRRSNDTISLTDRDGSIVVALKRPPTDESEEPQATTAPESASPEPSASATEAPTASPTPEPTPSPSPSPTPSPTPEPSATAAPTAAPSVPPSIPPIDPEALACDVVVADATLARLAYPASWFTVSEPAELACRYFDRAEITVPDDPTTLTAAITVQTVTTPYAEVVAAATDETAWTVTAALAAEVDSLPATVVAATAATDAAGIPVGQGRVAYVIDVGSGGTMILSTVGDPVAPAFAANAVVLGLMVQASSFTSPD